MIGIFAGRGDVVLSMAMAFVFGSLVGWQLHRLKQWIDKLKSK